MGESVAEFAYQPGKCDRPHRMVVVRKEIQVTRGQRRLFEDEKDRYFFYITNLPTEELPARRIVAESNQRCDQENHNRPAQAVRPGRALERLEQQLGGTW